jgi:hypothetical protein
LCKIGAQGPGGGLIFFVDYNDLYPGFDYLEAAPASCESSSQMWSQTTTASVAAVNGWAARAVGRGQANTTALLDAVTATTILNAPAALYADGLTCGGKSDWFLGSAGETILMYNNLQGFGGIVYGNHYWTSSEYDAINSIRLEFDHGYVTWSNKAFARSVRPVRSF